MTLDKLKLLCIFRLSSVTYSAFLSACLTALYLNSCSDADPSARESETSTEPAWDNGISLIFANHCASCHPGSQPTDYTTYVGVKANITEEMRQIKLDLMPPGGGVSNAEKASLEAWIAAGLPETAAVALDERESHPWQTQ